MLIKDLKENVSLEEASEKGLKDELTKEKVQSTQFVVFFDNIRVQVVK